jgi:hypothetical protein
VSVCLFQAALDPGLEFCYSKDNKGRRYPLVAELEIANLPGKTTLPIQYLVDKRFPVF